MAEAKLVIHNGLDALAIAKKAELAQRFQASEEFYNQCHDEDGLFCETDGGGSSGGTVAQTHFKQVSSDLGSSLRKNGFKGSGNSYTLPSDTHHVMVGIQKSSYNTKDAVKFTANLKVVSKETWSKMRVERPHLPEKPLANRGYGSFEWNSRIGTLMPGGQDKWWTVTNDSKSNKSIGTDFISAIEKYGVPRILKQQQGS